MAEGAPRFEEAHEGSAFTDGSFRKADAPPPHLSAPVSFMEIRLMADVFTKAKRRGGGGAPALRKPPSVNADPSGASAKPMHPRHPDVGMTRFVERSAMRTEGIHVPSVLNSEASAKPVRPLPPRGEQTGVADDPHPTELT